MGDEPHLLNSPLSSVCVLCLGAMYWSKFELLSLFLGRLHFFLGRQCQNGRQAWKTCCATFIRRSLTMVLACEEW